MRNSVRSESASLSASCCGVPDCLRSTQCLRALSFSVYSTYVIAVRVYRHSETAFTAKRKTITFYGQTTALPERLFFKIFSSIFLSAPLIAASEDACRINHSGLPMRLSNYLFDGRRPKARDPVRKKKPAGTRRYTGFCACCPAAGLFLAAQPAVCLFAAPVNHLHGIVEKGSFTLNSSSLPFLIKVFRP